MAERTGFEPAVGCPTRAFQARTLDHSDTSLYKNIIILAQKLDIVKKLMWSKVQGLPKFFKFGNKEKIVSGVPKTKFCTTLQNL